MDSPKPSEQQATAGTNETDSATVSPDQVSPLPWKFLSGTSKWRDDRWVAVHDATDETVCNNEEYYPHAVREADAEFIVRACNSHRELLDALKQTMQVLRTLRDEAPRQWDELVATECGVAVMDMWLTNSTAIRKAEGR